MLCCAWFRGALFHLWRVGGQSDLSGLEFLFWTNVFSVLALAFALFSVLSKKELRLYLPFHVFLYFFWASLFSLAGHFFSRAFFMGIFGGGSSFDFFGIADFKTLVLFA